jgi:hypothetical protein
MLGFEGSAQNPSSFAGPEHWSGLVTSLNITDAVTKQEADGGRSVAQSRLTGVVFWEKPIDDEFQIICHGQHRIYCMLYGDQKGISARDTA